MTVAFKKYKGFLYYPYRPNSKRTWYEFFIEKDSDDIVYPFDSLLSFRCDWSMRRTKQQAEQSAKSLIDLYYTNPKVTEIFDRTSE